MAELLTLWLWRSTASITWSWLRDECAVDCLRYKACWRTQAWSHRKQGVGSHLSKPTFDVEVHSMCMWSRTRSPHRTWAWTAATHSGILNYYHSQRRFCKFFVLVLWCKEIWSLYGYVAGLSSSNEITNLFLTLKILQGLVRCSGESAYCQVWRPEFDPEDPYDGRKELILATDTYKTHTLKLIDGRVDWLIDWLNKYLILQGKKSLSMM